MLPRGRRASRRGSASKNGIRSCGAHFVLRPSGTEARDESAFTDLIDCCYCFRQLERNMLRGDEHARPKTHVTGYHRGSGKYAEWICGLPIIGWPIAAGRIRVWIGFLGR